MLIGQIGKPGRRPPMAEQARLYVRQFERLL
jgi:hypothetical protein